MLIDSTPRFSSFLWRLGDSNLLLDWDALELKRRQAQLQLSHRSVQDGSSVRSVFLTELFSDKVPNESARQAFNRWVKLSAQVADGDMASEELNAFAQAAWRGLSSLPEPERARGRGIQPFIIDRHKEALSVATGVPISSLGRPEVQSAVLELIHLVPTLLSWQQRLRPSASASAALPKTSAHLENDIWREFELEYNDPDDFAREQRDRLASTLDISSQDPWASSGLEPSPTDLMQMMRQGLGGVPCSSAAANSSKAAYSSSAREEEEDLGAEYEDGKRSKEVANMHWLHRWCMKVSGGDKESALTIADCVCHQLIISDAERGSSEALASQLIDMLGDQCLDDVMLLMENRRDLKPTLLIAIAKVREEIEEEEQEDAQAAARAPIYGATVTVTSSSRKMIEKIQRKEQRKAKGGQGGSLQSGGGDQDLEILSLGFASLLETEKDKSSTLILGPGMEFKIGGEGVHNMARVLPKGTTRKTFKGYEEVFVPPAPSRPPPVEGELVNISDLEDWAQLAFKGYKTLNRIQSIIFNKAFGSNENLLVCAPTGAGKTNIAMLSVLREVGSHIHYGIIQKDQFKIVYVAPMKALAAEVTVNFSKRLSALGLVVRELTGDMQLSKKELSETQMIVTTPEKWDVITRKGGDVAVASLVRLLIIDEVHLLNDERGPVIETLVARTLRQVEASQSMIRIVGLSATLPNYEDVARFLHVVPTSGLFHFDASYRPVPLETKFIGVSVTNHMARNNLMTEICFEKIADSLKKGNQCMVFVHSRKDTGKTARALAELAGKNAETALFDTRQDDKYPLAVRDVKKSRNRELVELFDSGFGIHHAGMLRGDRTLTERLFADGLIKVLVCTATLAWGVNLPAHTVIIKGTQVYDAQKGAFNDLGMLDVQQIFGRAGRPQFDTSGEGIIITTHNKLAHYLGMLTNAIPIESQFKKSIIDNLNAEIVLGTVTNIKEAVHWLGYTYLSIRMARNPLHYALTYNDIALDPSLEGYKKNIILEAAKSLKASQMAVFDERSGQFHVTELGRVASHFYIRHQSIQLFNATLKEHMNEGEVLSMIANSSEFESMAVRDEELPELDELVRSSCHYSVKGGAESKVGKINVLMQAYIARPRIESFSLTADCMYVSQNVPRIMRALFEIVLRRKWSSLTVKLLELCKCFERRMWPDQHLLRQFDGAPGFTIELLTKLEDRGLGLDALWDMAASEIGSAVRHPSAGGLIRGLVDSFPTLELDAQLLPITRTVVRVALTLRPDFVWKDKHHGSALRWLIVVEDSANEHIYHSESWLLTKRMALEGDQQLSFTIPIFEPLPSQYYVRAISEDWIGAEAMCAILFHNLVLPTMMPPHTDLLDLDPLPLSALRNPLYESLYEGRFTHFNPIQTQAFFTLYNTDENVLLGAPTGSGKTISSELTLLRLFTHHPGQKAIYIAPLKALVRERINDWTKGLCARLGKNMVELTGDFTPDMRALLAADLIICTPEKWDGISRSWQTRSYVKKVGLIIIDEIHLLGADRGPILEVIVSRMRNIATATGTAVRFVGLSTALANAHDLGDWLGINPKKGLFNFKPSVRPVPLEAHIQGYPGKFYCPRMNSMNKPAYAAIQMHSPTKPVIVFVSSRRQTRLTANDLITFAVGDERPQQFLRNTTEDEMQAILSSVKDASLRHSLQFGIGLHHAGLGDHDRCLVERLFVELKIQVLVATSTLAWGVNTPAHLVIIKGTEFYDAPTRAYVDMPITDVLQMMGRAGRPQYDKHGVAVIMVHEPKKQFYKRFLYEPFPVESSLPKQLANHLNAEIAAGSTITSHQEAVEYLAWTFLYRRLLQNPSYYGLVDSSSESLESYTDQLISDCLLSLEKAGCITLEGQELIKPLNVKQSKAAKEPPASTDPSSNTEVKKPERSTGGATLAATTTGRICSFYYLDYTTMVSFTRGLKPGLSLSQVLDVLCSATEFSQLPVRHNEYKLNTTMAHDARLKVDMCTMDSPHTKANLLLQAHLSRQALPISDYLTDTKSVLDQSLRVMQAMIDICSDKGWLDTVLVIISLVQGLVQGSWPDEAYSSLLTLPHALSSRERKARRQRDEEEEEEDAGGGEGCASGPAPSAAESQGQGQGGRGRDDEGPLKSKLVLALVSRGCESLDQLIESIMGKGGQGDAGGGKLRQSIIQVIESALRDGSAGMAREVIQVVERLPRLSIKVNTPPSSSSLDPPAQSELDVEIERLPSNIKSSGPLRTQAYAPRFPKMKDEGYFVIVGDSSTMELFAIKRISLTARQGGAAGASAKLVIPSINGAGKKMDKATVWLLSDAYIGLDKQLEVSLP